MKFREIIEEYSDRVDAVEFYCGNPQDKKYGLYVPAGLDPLNNKQILDMNIAVSEFAVINAEDHGPVTENYRKLGKGEKALVVVVSQQTLDRLLESEDKNSPKRFIDGIERRKQPVGYCNSRMHPGYLRERDLKVHECLGKQCPFLEKNEESPYWRQREIKKARKKGKFNGNNIST